MGARMKSASVLLGEEFGTISDLIRAHASERPTAVALVKGDERLSYAQLDQLMDRVATGLQEDGLRTGDIVAICAGTSIEYCAVFLGALRAGIAVAPISPSSTPKSILSMAQDCDAKVFFLDTAVADAVERIDPPKSLRRIALDSSSNGQSLSHWLAPAGASPSQVVLDPKGIFNIIYSSGTTGEPKGIVHSHEMRWTQMARLSTSRGYNASSASIVSTPLYSNTTLAGFLPAVAAGGKSVLMDKFDPALFLQLAQEHRATHAVLVPVQYRRIMAVPDFDRYDLSSFVMKVSISAPFEARLKAEVLKRWPGGLTEIYGLTEGGVACVLPAHQHPDKLHTVGKPAPGHEIKLIDDMGNEVERGQVGEVVGHAPIMMSGYYRRPEKTAEAKWIDSTGKRFILSGDFGRFDDDGFLVLIDRKKDMIISGGFNIYPSDLEAVLVRHAAVAEAAVVGVPSERWGETPVAFVVLKVAAGQAADEIRDWFNDQVGKMQRVAAVVIVPSLPRSAIGKVLKRELREQYTNA
jgi:long-chain acyl-CoA synthetase